MKHSSKTRPYKLVGRLKQSAKRVTRYPLDKQALADQRKRWWNSGMYSQISYFRLVDGEYQEGLTLDDLEFVDGMDVDPVDLYQYREWQKER